MFASLLQLAQVEDGALKDKFAPVDLAGLCRTMVELYEPSAAARRQTLCFEGPETLVLQGEKTLLGQLLANLIENAQHHTPEGTAITVSLAQAQGGPLLCVSDTGPGIPEAERARVTHVCTVWTAAEIRRAMVWG